jgi:hypothetical protein
MKTLRFISRSGTLFLFIVTMIVVFGCKKNEEDIWIPPPGPTSDWICLGGDSNALRANGAIFTLCADNAGNVYAAGSFVMGNDNYFGVAKWDGTRWSELGSGNNGLHAIFYILTLCTDREGNIYAAGYFPNEAGYFYVAKWDGSGWSELGTGDNSLKADGMINSICSDSAGNIYAAGDFSDLLIPPGLGRQYVAKWNGTSWSALGTDSNALNRWGSAGPVYSLCTDRSGNVYAAGAFSDSTFQHYVAKWNGTKWEQLGKGSNALNPNCYLWSICPDLAGNIYAARGFANPVWLNCFIDRWNGTNWEDIGKGTNGSLFSSDIRSICTDRLGNVYVAGSFENSNGKNYVARWDGTNWIELGGIEKGLKANARINSICLDAAGNVYAAGWFTNATGYYVAKYSVAGQ